MAASAEMAIRAKVAEYVQIHTGSLTPEPTEVTKSIKNVVGWLKQASIEVREAGKKAVTQLQSTNPNLISSDSDTNEEDNQIGSSLSKDGQPYSPNLNKKKISPISQLEKSKILTKMPDNKELTILHFNDVYNIESIYSEEPVGGATRFCTAIKSFEDLDPLVLFSGDVFSPSVISTFTNGEQMIPVLNSVGTHCAVFGNHDFDHGLDVLTELIKKTNFPWLMSNVVDNETGRPLGGGKITHFLYHNQTSIGLIGLVEKEWLETLPTIDPNEVTYIDFIEAGNKLAAELRNEGCDIVIALTHMRSPNDMRLAANCSDIDLILGGHDHVCENLEINSIRIVKSGTDFRQFSKITIKNERNKNGKLDLNIEMIDVTSDYEEDMILYAELSKYSEVIEAKMKEVLGTFTVELDGRFSSIRTQETNLGDWVCDVALAATGADIVIINAGTFRSDQIHPPGPFTMRELFNIIPMSDPLILLEVTAYCILEALENSVSAYPNLEGRFPQVAGISFAFDPSKPAGRRVDFRLVQVGDKFLNMNHKYRLCIKSYMYGGCDGYKMFTKSKVLMDEESCPELGQAIQNHFKAINMRLGKGRSKHRQSLVTLSRRHSMVQMLDNMDLDGPSPIRKLSKDSHQTKTVESHSGSKMLRRASLDDLEQISCQLAPQIQQRIIQIKDKDHLHQLLMKKETTIQNTTITEDDNE